jgi:hypothetical protein
VRNSRSLRTQQRAYAPDDIVIEVPVDCPPSRATTVLTTDIGPPELVSVPPLSHPRRTFAYAGTFWAELGNPEPA